MDMSCCKRALSSAISSSSSSLMTTFSLLGVALSSLVLLWLSSNPSVDSNSSSLLLSSPNGWLVKVSLYLISGRVVLPAAAVLWERNDCNTSLAWCNNAMVGRDTCIVCNIDNSILSKFNNVASALSICCSYNRFRCRYFNRCCCCWLVVNTIIFDAPSCIRWRHWSIFVCMVFRLCCKS